MADLPTGTVTFLFTDVEGSTRLLNELGDSYADVLAEHRRLLRDAFARHGGVEVDTQGDAFFVAFARASDALAAAREVQADLQGPVRIRIGLHTGEPLLTHDGYVSLDVHLASRIAGAAHGGQILVSRSTFDLVAADGLRDLGEHRLKDFADPVHLYQVGRGEFPPLKSLNGTNLSLPLEPIVGRERELVDVLHLIHNGCRLVTLTGPGGIGKTRLALELGAELRVDFLDGVWLVELAALRDPDLVLPTIAGTIGAKGDLADHVRDRELVLVLDNFEGVASAGPELSRLLSACTDVAVLVTSRERLHVQGEREYRLRPLEETSAVELLRQRAAALVPEFESDDRQLAAICRRVDRLPLAIELAAARMKLLSPSVLLERLERQLPVLEGGRRDAPARHRTVRATIDWSYALLTPEEQRLFARLSVFAGGFALEAAESVCDAELETLASLVDKSLLHRVGERFATLEIIRDYASRRLGASGEEGELRRRHAGYFLALAEPFTPASHFAAEAETVARLEADHDNFRAALAATSAQPEVRLRLALALWPIWRAGGFLTEARLSITDALGSAAKGHEPLQACAFEATSDLAGTQGDYDEARTAAAESLALYERLGDADGIARALLLGGWWALQAGDSEGARPLLERAREVAPSHPLASERLGVLALHEGEYGRARELFDDALAGYRDRGDSWGITTALLDLGLVALTEGRHADAAASFLESLDRFVQADDTWGISYCAEDLAALIAADDPSRAAALLGWAEHVREPLGHPLDAFEQGIHDRTLATIRERLDDEAFAAEWNRGRRMTRDEAIALATLSSSWSGSPTSARRERGV